MNFLVLNFLAENLKDSMEMPAQKKKKKRSQERICLNRIVKGDQISLFWLKNLHQGKIDKEWIIRLGFVLLNEFELPLCLSMHKKTKFKREWIQAYGRMKYIFAEWSKWNWIWLCAFELFMHLFEVPRNSWFNQSSFVTEYVNLTRKSQRKALFWIFISRSYL